MPDRRPDSRPDADARAGDLAARTWPEVAGRHTTLVVPVGSLEQHGPHLPLDTDTRIASAVAAELVARTPGTLLAPALSLGSSGEHQAFPGTVSIGTEALRVVVIELTRSARTWADRVVFVNAHGGNVFALRAAVDQLRAEGHDVDWLACATEAVDLHAGVTETSLLLHIDPAAVHLDRAEAGNSAPLAEILAPMMADGVRAVSPNGVLGDPAGARAESGRAILDAMVAELAPHVEARTPTGTP
ncbi:mycofactocin biosynthesis peptidyl-dipeptidase MftE [Nocardioides ultimimeridianus]